MADPEVVVAVVALVVSLIALAVACMQAMQQYYASARGYSQCNEKVMGKWAQTKSRRFSWEELRFEVQFDAPVIFLSHPKNKNYPIPNAESYLLDGTDQSLKNTWTELEWDPRMEYANRSAKEKIHTADNERASWSILLSTIQRMEAESRRWQENEYSSFGPPEKYGLPSVPPSLEDHHTLTVSVQRKRKSWDTMPPNVTKPYATTTMCHLVEMMAALGIYWKEFDRGYDRYRGEGNGFVVLGERISDLGLMFSFQVYGKCTFGRNRVIPVDEVKELCFGYVPTIYRGTLDRRRLKFPDDEPQNLSALQMASRGEIAETLILIGCNNNTVRHFTDEGNRTSHLFPISFEILAMLSRTFHIKNSAFTYIPNPTPDTWDKCSVSLIKMMESYHEMVQENLPMHGAEARRNPVILEKINSHIEEIVRLHWQNDPDAPRLPFYTALHNALDDTDIILTARIPRPPQPEPEPDHQSKNSKDRSADITADSNEETEFQKARRERVQDVLRSHIQVVVRLLNEQEEVQPDTMSLHVPERIISGSPAPSRFQPPRFEGMNAASPDTRQDEFMQVYFDVVRHMAVSQAAESTMERGSARVPPSHRLRRAGTGQTQANSIIQDGDSTSIPPIPHLDTQQSIAGSPVRSTADTPLNQDSNHGSNATKNAEDDMMTLVEQPVYHDDIWCTLVFRMICWLMLHDFDKKDVQVNKSALLGSRMPVYIS